MQELVERLFATTNAFDVEGAAALFADDAVLEDFSVGHTFHGRDGVRRYLEDYFEAYRTVTRILSVDVVEQNRAAVRVDFTGTFGHEIGIFDITADREGRIAAIHTRLE